MPRNPDVLRRLRTVVTVAIAALMLRVLVGILMEYRWYFPADFQHSAFLGGRRFTFQGIYRVAFYAHIICGPMIVLLAGYLMLSGGRVRYRQLHRFLGKLQMTLVLAVLVPTGLIMAQHAYAGLIAGLGFAALSLATAACAVAAICAAINKKFQAHQRWATRCSILLISPLLLRLLSGLVITIQMESDSFYRLNAWVSWLVPLVAIEIYRRCQASRVRWNVHAEKRPTIQVGGAS